MLIRLIFIILILFLEACQTSNKQSVTDFTSEPIYQNPESNLEDTLVDMIHDSLVKAYFSIPEEAVRLHNGSLISALSDSNNGVNFEWNYKNYFGLIRVVKTSFDNKNLCRTWLQKIGKTRGYSPYGIDNNLVKETSKTSSKTACFDFSQAKWFFIDDFFDQLN